MNQDGCAQWSLVGHRAAGGTAGQLIDGYSDMLGERLSGKCFCSSIYVAHDRAAEVREYRADFNFVHFRWDAERSSVSAAATVSIMH